MQRSRRRPICSTASASSPSSTTLRSLRRRSRTPSAGGDFFTISEETKSYENVVNYKLKPRSTKYNMRVLSNDLKTSKKNRKVSKSVRSTLNGLQNTIVLAPFNTLKKCFQTKLVDLYSQEKMKKINHKIKMAKKPNTSFEYDVIELKTPDSKSIKKEKNSKVHQTSGGKKNNNGKNKRNTRSESYCQCQKISPKSEIETLGSKESKTRKLRRSRDPSISDYRNSPIASETKRRKLGNDHFTPIILKGDVEMRRGAVKSINNLCLPGRSGDNISATSSHSKGDSLEEFRDLPNFREEHLEGSLAISTTSFDSCLEQCGRDGSNLPENKEIRNRSSRYRTSLAVQKEGNNDKNKNPIKVFDVLPKPKTGESKHLIMNVNTKSSDGQIVGFMEREPQTQLILLAETSQHLQPLRRQKRAKEEKQKESESSTAYFLRSANLNKGKNVAENFFSQEQNTSSSLTCVPKINENYEKEAEMNDRVEVGIQVESNFGQSGVILARTPNHENSWTDTKDLTPDSLLLTSFRSVIAENSSNSESKTAECSDFISKKSKESLNNPKISSEMIEKNSCMSNMVMVNEKLIEKEAKEKKKEESSDQKNKEKENKNSEADLWEESLEAFLDPPEPEQIIQDPLTDLESRFPGSSVPTEETQGLQEKESPFIFGPRNASARLGESCEFSFGLNFVFSDEEDTDHGEFF